MKKSLLIILAVYMLGFTFLPREMTGSLVMFTISKIRIEPIDAALSMLGTLEADKFLKNKKQGDKPKET